MLKGLLSLIGVGLFAANAYAAPQAQPSSQNASNQSATNQVTITTDDTYRYIKSNGIPRSHGDFPNSGNPNTISPQKYDFRMPLRPMLSTHATLLEGRMDFGVGIDGVPFDPGTAEMWNNNPAWREEAIVGTTRKLGIDFNNAHVQPTGAYHYHGMPTELTQSMSPDKFSPIIGWAADGFPIYALYGYLHSDDADSGIKEMQSSYKLKSGTRPSPPNGPGGTYDGTYTADYEFIEGRGDLDPCNGTFGPTPDFPGGTYYYFITWDFPRIPRCFRGTPDVSFMKEDAHMGPPGMGGPGMGPAGRGRRPSPPPPPQSSQGQ